MIRSSHRTRRVRTTKGGGYSVPFPEFRSPTRHQQTLAARGVLSPDAQARVRFLPLIFMPGLKIARPPKARILIRRRVRSRWPESNESKQLSRRFFRVHVGPPSSGGPSGSRGEAPFVRFTGNIATKAAIGARNATAILAVAFGSVRRRTIRRWTCT